MIGWWWGTSLAYEHKVLPWYISKRCELIHCVLAKDREAESTKAMSVFSEQLPAVVGTEQREQLECMCTCLLYLHLRQTLLNNIYAVKIQP